MAVGVPEGCRRMVKSLKEVVGGCPDSEIYSMLKDCNMDPNEAVHRLLSQDPFHEVKSKREKKKENKSTTEPKTRGTNNNSSRGYGRGSGTQFSSSESTPYGKPAYKKENINSVHASQSSVSSGTTGNNAYRQPPAHSNYVAADNKNTNTDSADGGWPSSVPSSGFSQPPSGNQPVWGGVPGQVSMADIVKRGRPQHDNKASSITAANQSRSYHDVNSSGVSHSKKSPEDEWPLVEPSTRIISPVVQPSLAWHTESSHLSSNEIIDQHYPEEPEQDEVPAVEEDEYVENNHDEYAYNNSEGASHLNNNDVYENVESYQPHDNAIDYREVEDVGVSESSLATNLQQLNIEDEREVQPEEDEAAVIIPNHLQVQNEDLLHLSFGSFGSLATAPASSVPFSSRPTNNNTEEGREDVDASSVGHLDTRNSEYYMEEPLRTASDGNLAHRTGASVATAYDTTSVSQSEALNQENHEAPHENQYAFPSSSNYSFENAQQLNASFPPSHTSAQMQQTFSDAYGNTLPSSLLAANAQSARESDYSYSPFAMGSMPAKYGNTVPSVSSSSVSMPEVLKAAGFSSNIQTPQNLPGSNIATGPALPQQLMHQYSQIGQYANLIGYPFLPQSYYLPGAYQQAFAGNNAYHQSLLPQYKNSVSVSSLPQSAAVASGYGGSFGSSTSLPGGNFPTNQTSPPSAVGYEDVLSSQYKEANHLLSLQQAQNENQAMWVQGHGSRTMSGIPANTYYNYQAQNQQQQSPAGFRQNQQQPTQNYGAALGNSNFYHSQSGMLLDHQQQQQQQQQQNSRDGSLVASQVQANKQQSQQLWQNSY